MKKLNAKSLQVGDVILTTTSAKVSKAIRVATRSDISHAMVYVQDHSVIDAAGDGVHSRNTQRLPLEDDCTVYVLRLRDGLTKEQARKICIYVRAQVGAEYTVKEAVRSVIGGARDWTRKQFCSRLVAQAYRSAGVDLVEDADFCSPADLQASPLLVEVADAVVPLSPEEVAYFESREDVPQLMRDATNRLLDGARKLNKDIQSFDDLHLHVIKHPEDDEYVFDLLNSSGFLDVWKIEKNKNAWQYELALMKDLPTESMEQYCWGTLSDEENGPNRYVLNRASYALLVRQFERQTLKAFLDLYSLLASLHKRRVEVATSWLVLNGYLELVARPVLTPHTPEWFAAFEQWDPGQAALTRKVIELAGSKDVCSICGDDPASDYRLPEPFSVPAGVDTLRLCEECLTIRRKMDGPYEGPI